jgi:hypothetical protein
MNTPKMFLTAAALLALPIFARAAVPGTPTVDDQFRDSSPAAPAIIDNGTATIGGKQFVSSGIMIHDGAAYIVHRLQGEMALPNGSKVEPNGTVVGGDGKAQEMKPDQMMTLDGKIKAAPFSAGENKDLFDTPSGSSFGNGTKPSDFFAPSSGNFPGVIDSLNTDATRDLPAEPEESEFSD